MLGKRLGLGPKSRAAYVAIDLGLRQPTDAEAVVLADWLGGYPTDELTPDAVTAPGVSSYLERIDALVGSVSDLIGELRAARAERDATVEELQARVRALEAWRAIPDRSAGEGSGALSAHQG